MAGPVTKAIVCEQVVWATLLQYLDKQGSSIPEKPREEGTAAAREANSREANSFLEHMREVKKHIEEKCPMKCARDQKLRDMYAQVVQCMKGKGYSTANTAAIALIPFPPP